MQDHTTPTAIRSDPTLSIVVPVYNEEASLVHFIDAAIAALPVLPPNLELIFVDDGSRDGSLKKLVEFSAQHPWIIVVELSRNFGKEAALSAGLIAARNRVVVLMDSDLQHPFEAIPEFIRKWCEGYDIVYGVRDLANRESWFKRKTSIFFYRAMNAISSVNMPQNAGDFRLLDRSVVEAISALPEHGRFLKGIYAWVGFRSIGIPYRQHKRIAGRTSWNYWKLWNFALDGLLGFSTVPLRIWSYIGFGFALIGLIGGSWITVRTLLIGSDQPGYPSVFAAVVFMGGLQLISLGVLGEYVGRIFVESKRRPAFIIAYSYRNGRLVELSKVSEQDARLTAASV